MLSAYDRWCSVEATQEVKFVVVKTVCVTANQSKIRRGAGHNRGNMCRLGALILYVLRVHRLWAFGGGGGLQ